MKRRSHEQTRDAGVCCRLPAAVVLTENIQMFKKLLNHVDCSYAMFGKA